jgi:site-specific DNA-cytosine methylase
MDPNTMSIDQLEAALGIGKTQPKAGDSPQRTQSKQRLAKLQTAPPLTDTDPEGRGQTGPGAATLRDRGPIGRTIGRLGAGIVGGARNIASGLNSLDESAQRLVFGKQPQGPPSSQPPAGYDNAAQSLDAGLQGVRDAGPWAYATGQYSPMALMPGFGAAGAEEAIAGKAGSSLMQRIASGAVRNAVPNAVGGALLSEPGGRAMGATMAPLIGGTVDAVAGGLQGVGGRMTQSAGRYIGRNEPQLASYLSRDLPEMGPMNVSPTERMWWASQGKPLPPPPPQPPRIPSANVPSETPLIYGDLPSHMSDMRPTPQISPEDMWNIGAQPDLPPKRAWWMSQGKGVGDEPNFTHLMPQEAADESWTTLGGGENFTSTPYDNIRTAYRGPGTPSRLLPEHAESIPYDPRMGPETPQWSWGQPPAWADTAPNRGRLLADRAGAPYEMPFDRSGQPQMPQRQPSRLLAERNPIPVSPSGRPQVRNFEGPSPTDLRENAPNTSLKEKPQPNVRKPLNASLKGKAKAKPLMPAYEAPRGSVGVGAKPEPPKYAPEFDPYMSEGGIIPEPQTPLSRGVRRAPSAGGGTPKGKAPAAEGAASNPLRIATGHSGGGTVESGMGDGVQSVLATEYDPKKIAAFNRAHGTSYSTRDINKTTPAQVAAANPDIYHGSPVCKSFSKAKSGRTVLPSDMQAAKHYADVAVEARPPSMSIENVPDYLNTVPYQAIAKAFDDAGFTWEPGIFNAADYGGAMERKTLIVRAVRHGDLPPLPERTGPSDWYETIKDLIPDAPRSTIPEWEMGRIRAMAARGTLSLDRPVITMGGSMGKSVALARNAGYAAPDLGEVSAIASPKMVASKGSVPRILMPDGTQVRVTPKMMLRLMGLPEETPLPANPLEAKEILGNGVHGELSRKIIKPLAERGAEIRQSGAGLSKPTPPRPDPLRESE